MISISLATITNIALEAKVRFLKVLREQFNSGVKYRGHVFKWDTVIEEKTTELARYLNNPTTGLDFAEPAPELERTDNRVVREAILQLTQKEARKRGIGKSTLHYLRMNAKTKEPFRTYGKVRAKLAREERTLQ